MTMCKNEQMPGGLGVFAQAHGGEKPWLGRCQFLRPAAVGQNRSDSEDHIMSDGEAVEGYVAVWAQDREGFEQTLRHFLDEQSGVELWLFWAEDVMPATDWIIRRAREKDAIALARLVHAEHRVELGALAGAGQSDADTQHFLTVEEKEVSPLPDQTGIPFWDRQWISPVLKDLLFGKPENEPHLKTYLIVDAALRKNIVGMFDLDVVDVPVRCLFKGKAEKSLKDAAPYLVDMTLPEGAWDDSGLVPRFHKDFFTWHWGRNTGIFVRTTADMAEVWNHFRKFTYVSREGTGQRVFMRFWDEQYVRLYFPHIADNPERVAMWFRRDGFTIRSLLAEEKDGAKIRKILLCEETLPDSGKASKPYTLSDYDLEPFRREQKNKDIRCLADALKDGFARELATETAEAIQDRIAGPIDRMRGYGFSRKGNLYLLAAWSIFFGEKFEMKDREERLLEICQSKLSEDDKMIALKERMAVLSVSEEVAS